MGNMQGARALLGGPVIYMVFVAAMAIVIVLAAIIGRLDPLLSNASRAADRLQRGMAVPMVWGTPAVILATVIGMRLLSTPARLLGVLIILLLLALAGVGVGVAALTLGRTVSSAAKGMPDDDLASVRLGISLYFASEFMPFAGWILVFLTGCAGSAAFLEALFHKPDPVESIDQIPHFTGRE